MKINHPKQIAPLQFVLEKVSILPRQTRSLRTVIAGIPVLEIRNLRTDRRRGATLVYIHGGGFTLGSPDSHRAFAARLMQAGCFESVVMPQYRLAPSHPWPAGLDDVTAFWHELVQCRPLVDFSLAGESAGANLCLSLALKLKAADSHRLKDFCADAGVLCELEVWHGLWHGFALFAPMLPEANHAIGKAGAWLSGFSR